MDGDNGHDVPHAEPWPEVVTRSGSDARQGLTAKRAQRRLEEHGPNELPRERPPGPWAILARQFRDPLIWILLGAITLSLVLGEHIEAVAIGVITAFTVILGFVQELRAQQAMEALREMSAPHANVVRGGDVQEIPARDVVPGDVLVLAQGDIVPADARLIEAADVEAAEAALTGESVPVAKEADVEVAADAPLGDRATMVHASTSIARGRARAVVTATGPRTEVGRIGRLLAGVERTKTPLEKQIGAFSRWLIWAAVAIIVLIVGVGVLRGLGLVDMLLFGVALAVAAVPEALPAVVTISLAVGARRMVRRNALVRRLPTVETLGGTTVICSDKTGTLTTGQMTVTTIRVAGAALEVTGAGFDPEGTIEEAPQGEAREALATLLEAAVLCTDATIKDTEDGPAVQGDPTEGALVVLGAKAGLDKTSLEGQRPRVAEDPFASEDKRMTTLHEADGRRLAYCKGAPAVVLASSDRWWGPEGVAALDDAQRASVQEDVAELAGQGMRVLAVAYRADASEDDMTEGLVFLGLLGIRDPPRPEARRAVQTCLDAGVRPVLITGDHPATARAVAAELGLPEGKVLTGPEVEAMDEAALVESAGDTVVYARVSPEHKLRIVAALQARGEVVAMTGDGVNDAPALRQADIGVAMGVSGTDVAKEAADMTLADDDFATIVAAVEEGRTIFDNVRKYIVYLLSTNFGELLLIAAAMLLGLPLPLTAVMILYVNLASDGLPSIALAVDPQEPDTMRRGPRAPGSAILDGGIVTIMFLGGIWSAAGTLAVFTWARAEGHVEAASMTAALATLVLFQFIMGFSFRTERHSLLQRPFANKWYNLAVAWEVLLLSLVIYLPPLQRLFGTAALAPRDWGMVLAVALSAIPVLETAKWLLRRRQGQAQSVAG